ncbi:(2Fe-2S)-binding protein [Leptolyngbya sp. FACHB-36]|uniref:(2Fe-2S)-binding protein n=1 Tax=Leptolyngbya sp. FACHB-36 TaxID=2692808 RepID=UPI0016800851|nr:(2Fe-2S)-binding protein [Leptolyngbya sp. FACHB-36]MBD2019988.1 (2Fe-2S)-binding protein [Leptolyngbya sp. FACHB-36]
MSLKPARKPAYCYCTECEHQTILHRQQANPLPFEQAMRVYCECADRCGSCLYPLEQLFRAHECYVESDDRG